MFNNMFMHIATLLIILANHLNKDWVDNPS